MIFYAFISKGWQMYHLKKPLLDHCRSAHSRRLTPIVFEERCCQHFVTAWWPCCCLVKGGGTQLPPTPHGHDDQNLRSWTESDESPCLKLMIFTACRFKYGIPPEVEKLLPNKNKPADSFTHRLIEISKKREALRAMPSRSAGGTQLVHRVGIEDRNPSTGWTAQVLEVDEEPDLQSRQVRRLKAEVPNLPENFVEKRTVTRFRECHEWTWIQFCKQYWFGLNTSCP